MPGTRRPRSPALPLPTPSEAAFDALLASFDDGASARPVAADALSPPPLPSGGTPPADDFLDALYARRGEFLARDRYASIGDADEFFSKIVGVTFEGRQDSVAGLRPGLPLDLVREPHNPKDPNAVAVMRGALKLGFLRHEIAKRLAPHIDAGRTYRCEVGSVTGGGTRSFGANIRVWYDQPMPEGALVPLRGGASASDVLRALIGERSLREAQRAVIERVEARKNTLAVLGTGRGKSLCFAYPATLRALEGNEKTLVLYPLRALANDQYDGLVRRLEPLGVRVLRANGSIDARERAHLMRALEDNAWDILCATPEFFTYHAERFRGASRPSLVVVDEAHHVFASTHRQAYGALGGAIAALGAPQVLALTATADDECFARIVAALRIDAWVVDPTIRSNLRMVDARNATNKLAYLKRVLETPGKAIVYCNSRSNATEVAGKLHEVLRGGIAFYHAGIPSTERSEIERRFREGSIRVVIATSAFGEGIDLPDVRNVVLYHLNFDFTEFNQQSGRAGRDGEPADIHLLFGEKDRNLNDFILERDAPTLPTLREIYREMRRIVRDGPLRLSNAELADTLAMDKVRAETIASALRIFAEAELITMGDDDEGRFIAFRDVGEKVDLRRTARYAEGEAEREAFAAFADVVLTAAPEVLENLVNRPIYPSNVPLVR